MKRVFTLFAILLFCVPVFSQIRKIKMSQVPEILPEGFRVKYGNIKPTDWIYDSSCTCYKAHFIKKTNECTGFFTADGKWLRTETEIDKGTIPADIMTAFAATDYKDWEIVTTMRIETADIPSGCQFNVKKGKDRYTLVFDLKGNLLGKGKTL